MKLIGAVRTGLLYDYSGTVADAYHFLLEEIMDRVDVLESVSHPSWEAVWFESCARPKTASAAIAAGITMAPLDRAWGDVQCCLNAESLEAQGQSGVTWPGYKGKSALVVSWENMNSCSSPGGVHWQTLEGDGWTLVKWRFSGCEAKEPGIYRALKAFAAGVLPAANPPDLVVFTPAGSLAEESFSPALLETLIGYSVGAWTFPSNWHPSFGATDYTAPDFWDTCFLYTQLFGVFCPFPPVLRITLPVAVFAHWQTVKRVPLARWQFVAAGYEGGEQVEQLIYKRQRALVSLEVVACLWTLLVTAEYETPGHFVHLATTLDRGLENWETAYELVEEACPSWRSRYVLRHHSYREALYGCTAADDGACEWLIDGGWPLVMSRAEMALRKCLVWVECFAVWCYENVKNKSPSTSCRPVANGGWLPAPPRSGRMLMYLRTGFRLLDVGDVVVVTQDV
mmetsp:Transcript_56547/g.129876  ORF Transcript_56547/g.129876 Transcript_56547/m.129876 type:complete len:454 (+) Transcript_56547:1593-2954(+)